ncbi:uncharacterized protein LOC111387640 isoform X2 [Olea europaea var. sylvestris]|uniref:uncharacterized protein LOC111387640 isoform X2 n=1 Tax=Olea europaea var. sylvestris TaxID=158386 RepID=UPI000C1D54A5|nr:uncharacterized protein LOC111387640 isoform X2 [Olea europaea var. sylvestris]
MPQTRVVADALGVVTICLVGALVLLGLFCTIYSFYFHNRIRGHGLIRLNYFSAPWIIRILLIFFAVWWGAGEIIRLNFLRRDGRVLDALNLKWQETVCKCYIVSNLGFAEPCLFLTLIFLLRASLQRSGTLSQKWNAKTAGYVLLCCLPMFVLQLIVILIGPEYNKENRWHKLPPYFIKAAASSKTKDNDSVALCTYPLLSTIFLGLFATFLTAYLFWLGRQILHLVINKVLFEPEKLLYDAIAFLAFLSLLCCAGVGLCTLVYLPVADSLALRTLQRDIEARRTSDFYNDTISLIANQSPQESVMRIPMGSSDAPISFSTTENDAVAFVELSRFTFIQH